MPTVGPNCKEANCFNGTHSCIAAVCMETQHVAGFEAMYELSWFVFQPPAKRTALVWGQVRTLAVFWKEAISDCDS